MAEDHLVGVVVQFAQGDESTALLHRLRSRNLEALRVGKDARFAFLDQNALLTPGAEVARRARIDVFPPFGVK